MIQKECNNATLKTFHPFPINIIFVTSRKWSSTSICDLEKKREPRSRDSLVLFAFSSFPFDWKVMNCHCACHC